MYDVTLGRFIQRDPLGFVSDGNNLYNYARNSPAIRLDPTGQADLTTLDITDKGATYGTNGKFDWPIEWKLHPWETDVAIPDNQIVGWVIQRVQVTYSIKDKAGKDIPRPKFGGVGVRRGLAGPPEYFGVAYLEAWGVQNDGTVVPSANFLGKAGHDWFWFGGTDPTETCGWIKFVGRARYYPGLTEVGLNRLGLTSDPRFRPPGAGQLRGHHKSGLGFPAQISELDKKEKELEAAVARDPLTGRVSNKKPSAEVQHELHVEWDWRIAAGQVREKSKKP